jgi:O-antigen ligase
MHADESGHKSLHVGKQDLITTVFLASYILLFYLPPLTFSENIGRVVMYAFLATTFLKLLIRQTPLKITGHSIWFFLFMLLGLLSSVYALNVTYVFEALYLMLVIWIVTFSFGQYIQDAKGYELLFHFFSYSPFILILYLVVNGITIVQGQRLGEGLFRNANQIAMFLMISLFCISWLIIYGKRKYLLINIITAIVVFYVMALTGGRKYLLIPLIFFLLLMSFKHWKNNKSRLLLFLFLYLLLMTLATWSIMNIPILYASVGVRFEGLLSLFKGDLANPDDSTLIRYMMIDNGWYWFTQRPIIGYGLNNFSYLFSQVLFDLYSHNNYIEILVALGILGFLAYYAFYLYIIIKLIGINDDLTGLRSFCLSIMVSLLIFEIGAVTYQYIPVQILLVLVSTYIWLYDRGKIVALNS